MDADSIARRRGQIISRRRSRWSMTSQRLEEIIAELMKPISDARKSFDTDLSALLEEYLTQVGLHALEQAESDGGSGSDSASSVPPNFAELAMLLQQSASIYGRKVDFLYQNVLLVSESLNNSTLELETTGADDSGSGEGDTPRRGARARGRSAALGFEHIALAPAGGARRSPSPPRAPPPTLPRVYIELEPAPAAESLALRDAAGEPLGALHEYRAAWRLRGGLLVEGEGAGAAPAPPIPLPELQAALAAAPPRAPSPPRTSTPLPSPPPAPPDSPPPPDRLPPQPLEHPPVPRKKRKSELNIDDLSGGHFKVLIKNALGEKSSLWCEFKLEDEWRESVIERRKLAILAVRRRLKLHALHPTILDFRGFEVCGEAGGFRGWSAAEGAAAVAGATAAAPGATAAAPGATEPHDCDSDDGFFEQSSVESEGAHTPPARDSADAGGSGPGAEWARRVAARAERAPPAPDVRELARAVLCALPPAPGCARWPALLARTRPRPPSHVLLATLFLANAGNVCIERPPTSPPVDGFSVRLVSTDASLYARDADTAFAVAPPER